MAQSAQPDADGADVQDAAEVRRMVREKMAEMKAQEESLTQTDNTLLKDKVQDLNRLMQKSKEAAASAVTRNSALDSSAILVASGLGVAQSGNLHKRTSKDFIVGLKRKFGVIADEPTQGERPDALDSEKLDWDSLGSFAARLFKRPPTWENAWDATLYEHPEKVRQKQQRRAKGPIAEAVRPEEQTKAQVNEQEDQTQTRRTKVMRDKIAATHAERVRALRVPVDTPTINFFHLVLNKDSFSQTIENIFDIAFLVKDGVLHLGTSSDGEPMLAPRKPPSQSDYDGGLQKVQNILRIDHPTYLELCQRYSAELTDARRLLKTRPPSDARRGRGQ